jgi:hypothetical protein
VLQVPANEPAFFATQRLVSDVLERLTNPTLALGSGEARQTALAHGVIQVLPDGVEVPERRGGKRHESRVGVGVRFVGAGIGCFWFRLVSQLSQ